MIQKLGQLNRRFIFVGDYYSFKTMLLYRIINKQYKHEYSIVRGTTYDLKTIKHNFDQIKFQLHDTSELLQYIRFAVPLKSSHAIIYVYEASSRKSFQMMQKFLQESRGINESASKILLGQYLGQSQKLISREQGAAFAAKNDMMFHEVLANDKEQILDQMLVHFSDYIFYKEGTKSIQAILASNSKKITPESYLAQLRKAYGSISFLKRTNQLLQQRTESLQTREKNMNVQMDMLRSQNQLLEENLKLMVEKIKNLEKIIKPIEAKEVESIIQVIDLFQVDNLRIKEQLKLETMKLSESEGKWQMKCRQLQSICEEYNNITIHNISVKLNHISNAYSKYKLMHCKEESIFVDQISVASRFSNILEGLDRSSIFQFE